MTTYPALCPLCSCPIQLLFDVEKGKPKGTIKDALEAHRRVVHPNEPEVSA